MILTRTAFTVVRFEVEEISSLGAGGRSMRYLFQVMVGGGSFRNEQLKMAVPYIFKFNEMGLDLRTGLTGESKNKSGIVIKHITSTDSISNFRSNLLNIGL